MASYATTQMSGSINFFLQWEEYFAAQEFFRRRRQRIAPVVVGSGFLILLGAIWLFASGRGLAAASTLVLGYTAIFGSPLIRRWASKRKWQREPLYKTEHEVVFSDDGLYFRMGPVESNLDWNYYQHCMESLNGFLLIYGDDSFNLLPKRAFSDEKMINDFRALVAKKLKKF